MVDGDSYTFCTFWKQRRVVMITEEELIPLMRNQETIYYLDGYYNDNIKELKLNDNFGFGYVDIDWDATRCLR